MVNINLVPEKIRSGETLKLLIIFGASTLVLPVIFGVWEYTGKMSELAEANKNLMAINSELDSPHLKEVVAEVEQFAQDKSDLDSKRAIVDDLRKRQVVIPRFLDLLPDLFPPDARAHKLIITDVKGTKHCALTGDFMSLEGVATVYDNLDSSNLITKLGMSNGPRSVLVDGRNLIQVDYNFDLQVLP